MEVDDDYPEELNDVLKGIDSSLKDVQKSLKPLLENERSEIVRKSEPLDVAKLDLVTAYAVNSLFWGYLLTQGVNPKTHPVKQELDRIRTYMSKVKEIEDRKNAPRLSKGVARRFIKGAMFDLEQKKSDSKEENSEPTKEENSEPEVPQKVAGSDEKKRHKKKNRRHRKDNPKKTKKPKMDK